MVVVRSLPGTMHDLSSYWFSVRFTVPGMSSLLLKWALNPIRQQLLVTHKTLVLLLHQQGSPAGLVVIVVLSIYSWRGL